MGKLQYWNAITGKKHMFAYATAVHLFCYVQMGNIL